MEDRFSVLFVCTGNVCRSPAAELLLTAHLRRVLSPTDADRLRVSSAGTRAPVGRPVHPFTRQALTGLGITAAGSGAAQLTAGDVAAADLVLTATREHRAAAARLHPAAVSRLFTLLEIARLCSAGVALPAASITARARALREEAHALRGSIRPADPLDDDLPDPINAEAPVHAAVVARIDEATRVLGRTLAAAEASSTYYSG